jgi:hypothetical protein
MQLTRIRRRLVREDGFTMIAVIGAISLVTLLVGAAVAATNGDLRLVSRDLSSKQAYAAAQAGIADYVFHLTNDVGYWTHCDDVPGKNTGQSAVNLDGANPLRDRTVQGATDGSRYAIELIPASTGPKDANNKPLPCSISNPTGTMLESSGPNIGTFRIRSTGFSGNGIGPGVKCGDPGIACASIVATFKQATFLDYVYFTQLETSDPVTYGFANPSVALTGAYSQCTKFRRDGRESASIPGTSPAQSCDRIVFVSNDKINGPVHTNDDLLICGTPTFGRNTTDITEVSASTPGWSGSSNCSGNQPTFKGPFVTNAPVLTPPPTNISLSTIAGPDYTYTGQTEIVLSGNTMQINGGPSVPIPTDGVVYVKNGSCTSSYSPFTATYPPSSGCGNALVKTAPGGSYTGQLTIAAENDVIIEGDIHRASGSGGLLGLLANNFVRVMHPICASGDPSCANGTTTAETAKGQCNSGTNGNGSLTNPTIDAAILAISHSFIVDHYDCGGTGLGALTVNGAISQKFRGAVGTTSNNSIANGYSKSYNYDDRLRYQEPPYFFDPVQSAWHIQRETVTTAPTTPLAP